jgi:hypothetical protein
MHVVCTSLRSVATVERRCSPPPPPAVLSNSISNARPPMVRVLCHRIRRHARARSPSDQRTGAGPLRRLQKLTACFKRPGGLKGPDFTGCGKSHGSCPRPPQLRICHRVSVRTTLQAKRVAWVCRIPAPKGRNTFSPGRKSWEKWEEAPSPGGTTQVLTHPLDGRVNCKISGASTRVAAIFRYIEFFRSQLSPSGSQEA